MAAAITSGAVPVRDCSGGWDAFARRDWRRHAARIINCQRPPAEDVVFDALRRASESMRAGARTGVSVFRDFQRQSEVDLYPKAADETFQAWCRRAAGPQDAPVTIIASAIHGVSTELWRWAIGVLGPLFDVIGLPPFGAELGIFGGTYSSTALGVHTDGVDVFMFVVRGRKRIRIWEPSAISGTDIGRHALDYAALRSRSVCIEPKKGEAAYWPAGHWHVGESRGVTLSLNIALGIVGGIPSQSLVGTARQFVFTAAGRASRVQDLDAPMRLRPRHGRVRSLEGPLRAAERSLRANAASGKLRAAILEEQLNRQTALGFRPPPPVSTIRRNGKEAYTGIPIAWARHKDRLLVSAAGRSCTVKYSRLVGERLARLTKGPRFNRNSGGRRSGSRCDRRVWAQVRRLLYATGALRDTAPPSAVTESRARSEQHR